MAKIKSTRFKTIQDQTTGILSNYLNRKNGLNIGVYGITTCHLKELEDGSELKKLS